MTPEQRHYLFVQSAIGSAVVNAVINGALGWGATHGLTEFPLWKLPGAGIDLVATAFGVAFGTCLGAIVQIRIDVARGKISRPALSGSLATWIARAPSGLFARAMWFGVIGAVVFGPPALCGLVASGSDALGRVPFVAVKAGFSAVEGALVTPFILLATLMNAPVPEPSARPS